MDASGSMNIEFVQDTTRYFADRAHQLEDPTVDMDVSMDFDERPGLSSSQFVVEDSVPCQSPSTEVLSSASLPQESSGDQLQGSPTTTTTTSPPTAAGVGTNPTPTSPKTLSRPIAWSGQTSTKLKTQTVRNTGAQAILDDELSSLLAKARAFRSNPTNMDMFIEDILKTPKTEAFTIDLPLGEQFKTIKKFQLRTMLQSNPGTLWESKFKDILFHKKNPTTLSLTF
ncbi:hypothetical protein DYB32_010018 [Aphanomyces invadans]|uniref:Uncharacterized protein n=1 Tax=Aphanomyces invadans TaxID=157072 RepID=A0A3R7CTD2_9STRA|nr:hypothetical protein DYB32_010018 [Aphanomyces invadans]